MSRWITVFCSLAFAFVLCDEASARGGGRSGGWGRVFSSMSAPSNYSTRSSYSSRGRSRGYGHMPYSGQPEETPSGVPPEASAIPAPLPPPPEPWFNSKPSTNAKLYKWQHPWFKNEITSPTPPTWPYRILSEKEGVALVVVAPPDSEEAKSTTPPPAATAPTVSPKAPAPQKAVTTPASPDSSLDERRQRNVEVVESMAQQDPIYREGSLAAAYSGGGGYGRHHIRGISGAKDVHVRSYTRSDGTFVRSHYRSSPKY